ncbi:hypothetical protein LIER_39568 [Lithospermum erythrorhizon]|uniref:Uncharacterized protein n=1 Tax=Lithospermum erythrorhizon TaxID=34254 RepID=A0AAV3QL50_LITER
MHKSDISL